VGGGGTANSLSRWRNPSKWGSFGQGRGGRKWRGQHGRDARCLASGRNSRHASASAVAWADAFADGVKFPSRRNRENSRCVYPYLYRNEDVQAAYNQWKN